MKRILCLAAFVALCAAMFAFLHLFTVSPESVRYLPWDSSERVFEDGTSEPVAFEGYAAPEPDGGLYRFRITLPEDLAEGDLCFDPVGLEITLSIDGEELYRSSVTSTDEVLSMWQAKVRLWERAPGRELEMLCRPLSENALFPPILRFMSDTVGEADVIAYANLTGLPTGAYAFAFALICGLFLLGVAWGKPDWSLLPLALGALGLVASPITRACGYYFLPESVNEALTSDGLMLVVIALLALYLLMNRRRSFWRLFGWTSLVSLALLAAFYSVSLARGSYLSSYINDEIAYLLEDGYYLGLASWLSFWMVTVCALISAYALTREAARAQSDADALALRERLATENYRAMERKLRENAALRHETNHLLAALDALCRRGDYAALESELQRLTQSRAASQPAKYARNFTIDAILQNAAAQAEEAGVRFEATALTPEELSIPESELCGFLMNMLDNALEAAQSAKPDEMRFVRLRVEQSGNFLAIRCENGCEHPPKLDAKGWPISTKRDPQNHGFGMRQMRNIAEKYGSLLDFSYADGRFTVQSALCLPEAAQKK